MHRKSPNLPGKWYWKTVVLYHVLFLWQWHRQGRPRRPVCAGARSDMTESPCIANQIQIRIFINDGYQVLFCIPDVTKNDDIIFAVKFRHNLPDHGGCQFQFRLFFLPHTIAKRNGKIRYFIPIPDRLRRAWHSQSSVHSDSWNRCVQHGQTVLKHFQILCQI